MLRLQLPDTQQIHKHIHQFVFSSMCHVYTRAHTHKHKGIKPSFNTLTSEVTKNLLITIFKLCHCLVFKMINEGEFTHIND